jgi:CheY-like chemotaxis protein
MTAVINPHILIVEDEPDGRAVVEGMLDYFQMTCFSVADAEDALVALDRNGYNIAVIDLALPGMDGFDLIRAIRSTPHLANLPCMAVTAYHTSSVKHQAFKAGFDSYLPKPLDSARFVHALHRLIAQ